MNQLAGVTYGTMGKGLHNRSWGDPKAAVTLNSLTQRGWGLTKDTSLELSAQHAWNSTLRLQALQSRSRRPGSASTLLIPRRQQLSAATQALGWVVDSVTLCAPGGTHCSCLWGQHGLLSFFLLVLKVCIQSNRFHYGFPQHTLFLSPFLIPSTSPAASSFWPTAFLQTMHFSPSHTFRVPPLFTENMQYLSFFCKNIYLLDVCAV